MGFVSCFLLFCSQVIVLLHVRNLFSLLVLFLTLQLPLWLLHHLMVRPRLYSLRAFVSLVQRLWVELGGEVPMMMNEAVALADEKVDGQALDLRVGAHVGGDLLLQAEPAVGVGIDDVAIAAGDVDGPQEIAPEAPVVEMGAPAMAGDAMPAVLRPNFGRLSF